MNHMIRISSFFVFVLTALAGSFPELAAQTETILLEDSFDIDVPSLIGISPSPGPGGVYQDAFPPPFPLPFPLPVSEIAVVNGEAVLSQDVFLGRSVSTEFTSVTSGLVRYAFDLSVDNREEAFSGTDFEFFAAFGASGVAGLTTLVGRLDIVAPNSTGDFSIGISTSSSEADAIWGADFAYGESISVLVDYDIDNEQAFLSVNGGSSIAANIGGLTTSIDNFTFLQNNSNNAETIRVDNLRVSALNTVPEPSSILVLGLSGLLLASRRRKT